MSLGPSPGLRGFDQLYAGPFARCKNANNPVKRPIGGKHKGAKVHANIDSTLNRNNVPVWGLFELDLVVSFASHLIATLKMRDSRGS